MRLRTTLLLWVPPLLGIALFLAPVGSWTHLGTALIGDILPDELSFIWIWDRLSGNFFSDNPLFDGRAFYPYTESLLSSETTFGCSLIYHAFFLLVQNRALSYNLTILFLFWLNYRCMFFFVKLFLNEYAAAIAATVFAFSLSRLSQIGHAHMIPQFGFPFFFYALFKFQETRKWSYAFSVGTCLALQFYFSVNLGLMLMLSILPLAAFELHSLESIDMIFQTDADPMGALFQVLDL